MKKTYDQVRDEKIRKIKGFLFNFVISNEKADRMPFQSVLIYILNSFKLGFVSRKDYRMLYGYFYRLKKKRRKLVEEKRISEEFLTLVYKKLQSREITYEYARKVLDLVKPYLGNTKYNEWNKVFSNLNNDDKS
jgi:hypothetical protein